MNPFANRTILVVENNAHMRRMLCAVLGAFGTGRIVEADNALTGYLLACSENIDAVLLDFFLGERDGAEFVRLLRCDAACMNRVAPIVIVTALPTHPRVAHAVTAGANKVVSKPIAPRELHDALTPLLRAANEPRANAILASSGLHTATPHARSARTPN